MNIAVIKDDLVENIIVCDSVAIAEEITGLKCVEYGEKDTPHIGLGFDGEVFEQPSDILEDVPTVTE